MQSLSIKTSKSVLNQNSSNFQTQVFRQNWESPNKVEKIHESRSPDPPMSPMTPASPQIQKDCPICLGFMTEPCKLPENPCEHRMCYGCIKDMFQQGSTDVFKFDKSMRKVCVKCPICRAYSFSDLNDNFEEQIQIDVQHQNVLKIVHAYEFKANLDPEYQEEMSLHLEEQYSECIQKMSENCPLTFQIGIRDLGNKKGGANPWQEYVKLKNPEYQNIIDKILYRVDFCINETNLNGIKDPLVHMTNDYLFRTQKRKAIKDKVAPEITMQPMGISKGGSHLTQKPEFLPVKLYFNKIEGICCTQREIVHDDLQTGQNDMIEFIVIASKKALDELLEEED